MSLTPEQKVAVAAAVRSYVGVRWVGQGRNHQGIDCIGIVVMGFRGAGLTVDEGIPDYRGIDPVRLVRLLLRHCDRVTDGSIEVGDVVTYGQAIEVHVAMITQPEPIMLAVHSPAGERVVETRFDLRRAPIKGFYRWRS